MPKKTKLKPCGNPECSNLFEPKRLGQKGCGPSCQSVYEQSRKKTSVAVVKSKQAGRKPIKKKPPRQSAFTKSAKDQPCTLRIPGVCVDTLSDHSTTVLAHVGKDKGVAIKCGDHFAVYACMGCHDEIDRRTRKYEVAELLGDILRALEETQKIFIKQDLMVVAA